MVVALGSGDDCKGCIAFAVRFLLHLAPWLEMEISICQQPQIVSGDYLMNFHPFGPCNGSLESSNPTLLNHMGTSHFNTSYSIRSCSLLSRIFLLILTGSIASKGIIWLCHYLVFYIYDQLFGQHTIWRYKYGQLFWCSSWCSQTMTLVSSCKCKFLLFWESIFLN